MTDVIATPSRSPAFFAHLFRQIDALPQVLQDIISEYNVDHRPQMYKICKELLTAYHYRMFRFTYDVHLCDGDDCEKRYYECIHRSSTYRTTKPFKITKCLGHYYVFCSSACEWSVLHDVRKRYYRTTAKRSPYINYKSQIQKYLCFMPDCHCYLCVEHREFDKERREGTLDEFDDPFEAGDPYDLYDPYDEDYPEEFPTSDIDDTEM